MLDYYRIIEEYSNSVDHSLFTKSTFQNKLGYFKYTV